MRKDYKKPIFDVVCLDCLDIITTSGIDGGAKRIAGTPTTGGMKKGLKSSVDSEGWSDALFND